MTSGSESKVAVIGLGYVGLPLAVALAKSHHVVGVDVDAARIAELREGHDRTGELTRDQLMASSLEVSINPDRARGAEFYIVTVPTPIDSANRPDLGPVKSASRVVGKLLERGRDQVVVYESTVYPGVTEEVCGPLLEEISGLERGTDFYLGYSPERINPGDRHHTVDKIMKVVAGENPIILRRLADLYGTVTSGGVFEASSIKAAEALKVIENAQRDINIAFVNEITQIFSAMDLSIWDVLDAARTKWNFLDFRPGLVGGHCIGVDPFYLSHLAQHLGHEPRVILAGRSTNDSMGNWVADRLHTLCDGRAGTVLVLGLTFKANVPDLRNSKVIDLIRRLEWLGHRVVVHDPLADPEHALREYGLTLDGDAMAGTYGAVVVAVPHDGYRSMSADSVGALVVPGGVIFDFNRLWHGADVGDRRFATL